MVDKLAPLHHHDGVDVMGKVFVGQGPGTDGSGPRKLRPIRRLPKRVHTWLTATHYETHHTSSL